MTCAICQRPIHPDLFGWPEGHSAHPVRPWKRCCGDCYTSTVLPARAAREAVHALDAQAAADPLHSTRPA